MVTACLQHAHFILQLEHPAHFFCRFGRGNARDLRALSSPCLCASVVNEIRRYRKKVPT
jgi:hypothetical protein